MKEKLSIEEQVRNLTPEEQDKVVKVGKIATALMLIGGIPLMIICALGALTMMDPPANLTYDNMDKFMIGFYTALGVGIAYIIGIFLFVKIKYPFYSDAKCRYLMRERKKKK